MRLRRAPDPVRGQVTCIEGERTGSGTGRSVTGRLTATCASHETMLQPSPSMLVQLDEAPSQTPLDDTKIILAFSWRVLCAN